MVKESKRKIAHKAHHVSGSVCGTQLFGLGQPNLKRRWRDVNCKLCLRSKPKR